MTPAVSLTSRVLRRDLLLEVVADVMPFLEGLHELEEEPVHGLQRPSHLRPVRVLQPSSPANSPGNGSCRLPILGVSAGHGPSLLGPRRGPRSVASRPSPPPASPGRHPRARSPGLGQLHLHAPGIPPRVGPGSPADQRRCLIPRPAVSATMPTAAAVGSSSRHENTSGERIGFHLRPPMCPRPGRADALTAPSGRRPGGRNPEAPNARSGGGG
jgi:hypothetical protein